MNHKSIAIVLIVGACLIAAFVLYNYQQSGQVGYGSLTTAALIVIVALYFWGTKDKRI